MVDLQEGVTLAATPRPCPVAPATARGCDEREDGFLPTIVEETT
jgi:hypothetical protein